MAMEVPTRIGNAAIVTRDVRQISAPRPSWTRGHLQEVHSASAKARQSLRPAGYAATAALVATLGLRRWRTRSGLQAYEPFGGVYARDYALERPRRFPPVQSWQVALGGGAALAAAWYAAGSWTSALIGLNLISYLLQCYYPEYEREGLLIASTLDSSNSWHRLLLSTFLHGSWYHLSANMSALWSYGPRLERILGPGRFLLIYLGSGLLSGIASCLLKRTQRRSVPSVGASGAIFGVVAGIAVVQWRLGAPIQTLWAGILLMLAPTFFTPGVDNVGHIGGAVGGALLAFLYAPRWATVWGMRVLLRPLVTWPFP
mmetsp:Transcript_66112/g.123333  ORF Transcript_66112/g.123333 Transcript_66112/m.123333 type:complete len:315 (-) Transcript_66112:55-999(-)